MAVGYVYCWTDHTTHKLYVGIKKGAFQPNYISSSRVFNNEYHSRPNDFTRTVLATGEWVDCIATETAILQSLSAATCDRMYNLSNGNKNFVCNGHTNATRIKMSNTWKNKATHNCDNKKAVEAWRGSKHSASSKQKMSIAGKKHVESRRNRMITNNPMKSPEAIQKMLDTRRKNKLLKETQ